MPTALGWTINHVIVSTIAIVVSGNRDVAVDTKLDARAVSPNIPPAVFWSPYGLLGQAVAILIAWYREIALARRAMLSYQASAI